MSFGNRARAALTTTVLAGAATGFLAGCGTPAEEEVYCVNEHGEVVDADLCDDDGGGGYFLHTSSTHYAAGDRVPAGSRLIQANDATARTRAGLPATGKVAGTRVSGGIGAGTGRAGTGAGS